MTLQFLYDARSIWSNDRLPKRVMKWRKGRPRKSRIEKVEQENGKVRYTQTEENGDWKSEESVRHYKTDIMMSDDRDFVSMTTFLREGLWKMNS